MLEYRNQTEIIPAEMKTDTKDQFISGIYCKGSNYAFSNIKQIQGYNTEIQFEKQFSIFENDLENMRHVSLAQLEQNPVNNTQIDDFTLENCDWKIFMNGEEISENNSIEQIPQDDENRFISIIECRGDNFDFLETKHLYGYNSKEQYAKQIGIFEKDIQVFTNRVFEQLVENPVASNNVTCEWVVELNKATFSDAMVFNASHSEEYNTEIVEFSSFSNLTHLKEIVEYFD